MPSSDEPPSLSTSQNAELQSAIEGEAFLSYINDIDFKELEATGAVIAEMHNEGIVDAIQTFRELDVIDFENRRTSTRLGYILGGFAGVVRGDPLVILSFFHEMSDRLGQSNRYELQKGVENWLSKNSEDLALAVSYIRSSAGESIFLGTTIKVWRQISSTKALAAALDLCEDSRPLIKQQAIYALSGFASAGDVDRLAAATALAKLIDGGNLEERSAAIASAAAMTNSMTDHPADLLGALERACDDPSPEIRHQLISGWAFASTGYPEQLRGPIIALMKGVDAGFTGTIDVIDTALSRMDRDAIYDILTAILTNAENGPLLKMFDSTLYKIQSSDGGDLTWFAVKWLLEGNHLICSSIHKLFPLGKERLYDVDLSDFQLKPTEILYLSRKIFGYLMYYHSPAISLLYACLATLEARQRRALEDGIASFWLRNFPNDLEIFERMLASYPREGMAASVKRISKVVAAYEQPLRKLPKNPALRPSTSERRVQAEIARDQHAEIMKSADRESILSSLFHKSTLLYGRSSVTYIYNGANEPVRQVIALQSFETSSALPRMDGMYPARLSYLVYRFRSERRPK